MRLDKLPKLRGISKKAKRLGRGYSSGKGGHTVGRGSKGQKARGKVKLEFEGGQLPLIKRVPHKRGFRRFSAENVVINVHALNIFDDHSEIDEKDFVKKGVIKVLPRGGIKILGSGEIKKKIKLKKGIKYSQKAKEKIEKAGGTVV